MATIQEGYSAQVEIYLQVNGTRLAASCVGPDSITLREPRQLPPTQAQVVIVIDGHEKVHDVFLFEGQSGDSRQVRFH
jgi:hypothetical protein